MQFSGIIMVCNFTNCAHIFFYSNLIHHAEEINATTMPCIVPSDRVIEFVVRMMFFIIGYPISSF